MLNLWNEKKTIFLALVVQARMKHLPIEWEELSGLI